ncbi:MAG: hypothetical protein KF760_28675 [Candidatus Eremiobacteraeota bacterium]|nr:hypothetical protein [Candidatus Eremiobacteraeota bacterium]MCW5865871.1 hypothetical protein [Candidatus Eremiobacteraeota bacterium]
MSENLFELAWLDRYWQSHNLGPLLDGCDLRFALSHRDELKAILQRWCLESAERIQQDPIAAQNCIFLLNFLLEAQTDEALQIILEGFLSHPIESVAAECKAKIWRAKAWTEQRDGFDREKTLQRLSRAIMLCNKVMVNELVRDLIVAECWRVHSLLTKGADLEAKRRMFLLDVKLGVFLSNEEWR